MIGKTKLNLLTLWIAHDTHRRQALQELHRRTFPQLELRSIVRYPIIHIDLWVQPVTVSAIEIEVSNTMRDLERFLMPHR